MTQAISSLQELSGAIGGTVENLQELSGFSNSSPKQNLQYIYGHTYWIGVCSMSWNNLKKLRNFHHRLKIGDHLSEMLSEYIDINNNLPALSSEVVHHVVEILKFFNTRTCLLVLGTGALQVAGLKSITSKHLALCQGAPIQGSTP